MLSTDVRQKTMIQKIERVVAILMEESSEFKQDIDSREIVKQLVQVFQRNLPFEEFNAMPDAELKDRCSRIMSIESLSKIGKNFTSEQMAVFDEVIKRK
jgi:hypothetical protein